VFKRRALRPLFPAFGEPPKDDTYGGALSALPEYKVISGATAARQTGDPRCRGNRGRCQRRTRVRAAP